MVPEQPLIVILGPTASGKSDIALALAKQYEGEIIAADSRTVYKGLDIGTAKPSLADQNLVPHHLIDVAEPHDRYTMYQFQRDALNAIAKIRSRGKIPFLVGGSGLYIDSIIYDYQLDEQHIDLELRSKLEQLSIEELITSISSQGIKMPFNGANKRHLMRAIEQGGINHRRKSSLIDNCVVVGIATEKEELKRRVQLRIEKMFSNGVEEEALRLASSYGWAIPGLSGNVYQIVRQLHERILTRPEAINQAVRADMRLIKKQMTWFRRHNDIVWKSREEAGPYIETLLNR